MAKGIWSGVALGLALVALPGVARATNPFSDGSLGPLETAGASGPIVFDTDAGTYTIPGLGTFQGGRSMTQGAGHVGLMAFHFTSVHIGVNTTIAAVGSRGLALLATQAAEIDGTVDLSGQSSDMLANLGGGRGGAGGGGGGGGGEGIDLMFFSPGGAGGLGDGGFGNARGSERTAPNGSNGVVPGLGGSNGDGGRGGGGAGPGATALIADGGGGGGGGFGGGAGGGFGQDTGLRRGRRHRIGWRRRLRLAGWPRGAHRNVGPPLPAAARTARTTSPRSTAAPAAAAATATTPPRATTEEAAAAARSWSRRSSRSPLATPGP